MSRARAAAAALLLLAALMVRAQQTRPDVAPAPQWVVPISLNPRAALPPVDPSLAMRWVLKDRQINAEENENFCHEVRQLLTPAGVNDSSHLAVDYDPSYQLLTFHWVRIWRGTNLLNRLDPLKIEITPHGLDTDELLFDAKKTALLLLDDVRAGDMVDYAYTLQGLNPVFAGRFSDSVEVQSGAPIERAATRLLWPATRRLYVQNHGTEVKYTAVRKGNTLEFDWNVKNVPGWRIEPPLPTWYQPLPWVQLSEFQKWSDVNQLALGLFTNATPLTPALTQKINEWKRLPDRESRVVTALRFGQDEVRYLGIESGALGYRPAPPSVVFERRFGDCKDKSLLLVTLLRALGVEAWPALVNTRLRQSVMDLHPALTVFNHCISQVNLDGHTYWLDATANYERGPLAARTWPDYRCALIVRPGTTRLTAIDPSSILPRTTVSEYFQLGAVGQPSRLKIVTVAEGQDAEALRAAYGATGRDDIERANLNYYAKFYPEISRAGPLNFADDEQQNRVEVDEFYNIPNIWSRAPDETSFYCRIFPDNILQSMRTPALSRRTMPLGMAYPNHQFFHAEAAAPLLSLFRPDDQTIQNPAFYFHRTVGCNGGRVMVDYEYNARADAVPPENMPEYAGQLDAASALLSYTLTSN